MAISAGSDNVVCRCRSVSESDSDDDFGGPSFGSPKQQRATRPALSKSAVEPRRKSLRTEKPVDVNVPIGITTADTNPLAVEQDESSSLSRR